MGIIVGYGTTVTRRRVLETTAGALAGVGATGLAGATTRGTDTPRALTDGTVAVNVGYAAESGRRAAVERAEAVLREFAFGALAVRLPPGTADALAERDDVRYVEPDGTVRALAQTLPWGVDRIDADVARAAGETATGRHVAVIDTGIDSDHPDLVDNLGAGRAFVECRGGRKTCREPWDDDNGHGTLVAGVAGAVDNDQGVVGTATDVTLDAVKVLDGDGAGSISDVAAGIEYAADQGYDVANLSLGTETDFRTLEDAVEYARQQGVVLVAAAGGDGPCSDCIDYPAKYPEVVAVGATNRLDEVSSFSSSGPELDLVAPGSEICSTDAGGGYALLTGTSLAPPHVSGAAALLVADGVSPDDVRGVLCDTAEDLGYSSDRQGCGLVDVAAALGHDSSDDGLGSGVCP